MKALAGLDAVKNDGWDVAKRSPLDYNAKKEVR